MSEKRRIEIGLFILRIGCAAFFFAWSLLKFLRPEWAANIWKGSYKLPTALETIGGPFSGLFGVAPAVSGSYVLGIVQIAFVAAFAVGWRPGITYLVLLLMHSVATISIVPSLLFKLDQYPSNLLWTGVPTLAALFVVWFLRKSDRFLSVSHRFGKT